MSRMPTKNSICNRNKSLGTGLDSLKKQEAIMAASKPKKKKKFKHFCISMSCGKQDSSTYKQVNARRTVNTNNRTVSSSPFSGGNVQNNNMCKEIQ